MTSTVSVISRTSRGVGVRRDRHQTGNDRDREAETERWRNGQTGWQREMNRHTDRKGQSWREGEGGEGGRERERERWRGGGDLTYRDK